MPARATIAVDISMPGTGRRASWAAIIHDGRSLRRARGAMSVSGTMEAELVAITRALHAAGLDSPLVIIDSRAVLGWLWGACEPPASLATAVAAARAAIIRYRARLAVTRGHARDGHVLHKAADTLCLRIMRDRRASLARAAS